MAKTRIILNAQSVDAGLRDVAVKRMRRLVTLLGVIQLQQIADAFKRSGQPSKKWPKLWADDYVGAVPQSRLDKLNQARAKILTAMTKLSAAQEKKKDLDRKSILDPLMSKRRRLATRQISRAFRELTKAQKLEKRAFERAAPAESYRKDGQPLRDTGALKASFFLHSQNATPTELMSTVASPFPHAVYQHTGFKTNGPNFIPLTRKAARMHRPGADPRSEGLEPEVDYVMAWSGVHVPARPIIDYADPVNAEEITRTVQAEFA